MQNATTPAAVAALLKWAAEYTSSEMVNGASPEWWAGFTSDLSLALQGKLPQVDACEHEEEEEGGEDRWLDAYWESRYDDGGYDDGGSYGGDYDY